MNFWILPSNEEKFHLNDCLKEYRMVDWRQHNKFEVGDVVFIYNSKPLHRITHEMQVVRVDVPSNEYLNDRKYWVDAKDCEEGLKNNCFVRLQLVAVAPETNRLDLDRLRSKGLKGNLQSAIKIIDKKLLSYIQTVIQPDTKDKIARICWNTNGWERPSGPKGKAVSKTYEADNGYGHEEWLLDRRKIYSDGYHYAFLEPLRKSSFEGTKDIHLYTYTPENKLLYVGCIHDAEYVNPEKAEVVWRDYIACGWVRSMINDLKKCGIIQNGPLTEHFNIRFKFEKYIDYSDKGIFIRADDPNLTNKRYVFLNRRVPFLFESSRPEYWDNDAESITDLNNQLSEGAKTSVVVNRYERSQEARKACLNAHGYSCAVCGMNFEDVYGPIGKDFIHVHHVIPISEIGQEYEIDPLNDLVPVCPNCHAMLHHGIDGRVLTVDELKTILSKNKK